MAAPLWSYVPYTLYGMAVHIVPDTPKIILSKDVPVSEDFRIEMDRWMLEFFGITNLLDDGQVIAVGNEAMLMNQRTYRQLKQAMMEKQYEGQ